jgi:signal peptidase complex subunit 3
MHTLWVRLNAVVFFGLSALLGFSCLAALVCSMPAYGCAAVDHFEKVSFHFFPALTGRCYYFPVVVETLKLNKLKSLKPHGGVDRALLSFDLTVDLRPAFHWYDI